MLVLVGPSASGKSAIVKQLVSKHNMKKFITCTTRKPRCGEVDGVDYYFFTEEEFNKRYRNQEFIETVYYNGNYYGTLKSEVSDDKVVILEPIGLKSFMSEIKDLFSVFLKTDEKILKNRMLYRGDTVLEMEKRIQNDRILFSEEQISGISLVLETSNDTIVELAEKIYLEYSKFNNKK
jgi:guanylate kinase